MHAELSDSFVAHTLLPLQYWVLFVQQLVPQAVCELVHGAAHVEPLHPVDGHVCVGGMEQVPPLQLPTGWDTPDEQLA